MPANSPLPASDLIVILLYLLAMLAVGVWFARRSSKGLMAYFLGDRKMSWWALALSGSASNFDISGTLWLVSMAALLGMKSFWVFWSFAFLIAAVLMSWMARWIRGTGALTGVELLQVRFGVTGGAVLARLMSAVATVVLLVFMSAYAFTGGGKFLAVFFPWPAAQCATAAMLFTFCYAVIGGFRAVVVTDAVQAGLMGVASLVIAGFAIFHTDVAAVHAAVDPSPMPVWTLEGLPEDYAAFAPIGLMIMVWLGNGLLLGFGGAGGHYGEQRFLAAAGGRDAAMAGLGWGLVLWFRWVLVAAVLVLAASGFTGTSGDPERVLPEVILGAMPAGLRGLVVAGFLSAFMASFSSVLNAGSAIFVRDVVQVAWPRASERILMVTGYVFIALLVAGGIGIGLHFDRVNQLWMWILLGLMGPMMVPNVLRWYWWRMTGAGYAAGVLAGMAVATVVYFHNYRWAVDAPWPEYRYAPVIHLAALAGSVIVSLAGQPVAMGTLIAFYRKVRPFGCWGPVRDAAAVEPAPAGEGKATLVTLLASHVGLLCLFLSPFYLLGRWWSWAAVVVVIGTACALVLRETWWKRLPNSESE
jgi:Na+/proline symporter